MRADRLLSIVLLLQRHGHQTAKALSESLGVTERTIYRDVEALSMAGIPIYTRSGPQGGCFLDEHYRNSFSWFTGAELQTLLYSGSATPLAELGMQETMDHAVLKLLALLPKRHQQAAEQMQQRLYLDPSGWYGTLEDHPTLPLLKKAVWDNILIETHYETWEGESRTLTLAPYSLVYKSQRWYLVALNINSNEMRTFRVARLSDVRLQANHFERDQPFDIAAYWEKTTEAFIQRVPSYPVTMRVQPATMIYFRHMMTGRYTILEQGDDWWVLQVQYTVLEEARTSVLGLGTQVEVIEPQELHTMVFEQAQAIIAKYEKTRHHK